MICRKCGSEKSIKNGFHLGKQRYKCKRCNFQYTRETPKGVSPEIRADALLLYILGLSMRTIARKYNVATSTVLYWVRNFAIKTYEKPVPKGDVVIELDELWHFIGSKKTSVGYGRRIVALPVSLLTGNAGRETKTL